LAIQLLTAQNQTSPLRLSDAAAFIRLICHPHQFHADDQVLRKTFLSSLHMFEKSYADLSWIFEIGYRYDFEPHFLDKSDPAYVDAWSESAIGLSSVRSFFKQWILSSRPDELLLLCASLTEMLDRLLDPQARSVAQDIFLLGYRRLHTYSPSHPKTNKLMERMSPLIRQIFGLSACLTSVDAKCVDVKQIDAKQMAASDATSTATAAASAPQAFNGLEIVEIDPDSPRGNRKRKPDDAGSSSLAAAAASSADASDVDQTQSKSQKRHKPDKPSNDSK
jgi:hypothetical protein